MERGRSNDALRLDALKQAFLENVPQRQADNAERPQTALSLTSIARASGLDVHKAAASAAQTTKSAGARTQGRT